MMRTLLAAALLLWPCLRTGAVEYDPAASDGQALADELQAVVTEVDRQVAVLRTRSAAGDTRGVEEARTALVELRDRLALLVPVEEVDRPARPAAPPSENSLRAQISDMRST